MANNTTNFTLKLKTEGLENAQKGTKQIRDNLEGAQAAAQGIGTSGSRRVASSAAARPTGAAGVSAGVTGGDVEMYNRARGAAGAAGGTARDFADQARGLGGLVRLYATVAANVFALTAAFSALSRAMDTTNMVKGLDQLGAASGIALGSLSKRLVAATDGAVNLREAMEATVKAASSGMKTDDILRLGKVAQQASLALGVNMQDALSRLTRGITKLEPELLDELGIFTKLDPAVKEYAKSVNKSVSELTDFERRAAFANAVLAEGEQKFNAIKIDSNPYTKLAAAIQNATQKILELVNKVLGPVAEFFSKSPTALITGIGALAAILLKQAIPAIGEFRQGLERTAEQARELAQRKAADAVAARKLVDKQIADSVEARADKELAAVEKAEKKIQALQQGSLDKRSAAYKLLSKDLADIQEKDFQNVLKRASKLETSGKTQEAAAYREVVTALKAQKQAEEDLAQTKVRLTEQYKKDIEGRGTLGIVVRAGQKAEEAAVRSSIISNAAYNGSLVGLRNSFALLREEIAKNNIKGFDAAMLTARGTLAALGGKISTALSALNGMFMAIGVLSAAVALMDGIFSKASKEIADFSGAVDRTSGAANTLKNTLETIYKINPFSVQSLEAQANAMAELATSVENLVDKVNKAEKALQSSWWDKLKDKFKDVFGFGVRDEFTETLAKSISDSVTSLKTSPIKTEIEQQLQDLLKIKDVGNFKELETALSKLDPKSETVKKLGELLKKAGTEAGISAGKAREFSDAFKASEEAFRLLQKQYENKTPLTEWTNAAITSLLKLSTLINGPIDLAISSLIKLTDDVGKNPIFGSQSLSIAAFNQGLKESNKILVTNEASLKQLRERLLEVEEIRKRGNVVDMEKATGLVNKSRGELEAATDVIIKDLRDNIRIAEVAAAKARAAAGESALKINAAINKGLAEQVGIIATALSAELAKGSNKVLENLYSRIDFMPEYVKKQQELKLKELESEALLIKVNQELANQSRLLAAELAVTNAKGAIETAQKEVEVSRGKDKEIAQENLQKVTTDYSTAVKSLRLLKQAVNDPIAALKGLEQEFGNTDKAARSYAGSVLRAAQENVGFVKALQDNAQQRQILIDIETPLAEEAARLKNKQNGLNIEKQTLDVKKQQFDTDNQAGKLGQFGALEGAKALEIEQAILQEKIKSAEIDSKSNQAVIIYTNLIKNAKTEQDKLDADAYLNRSLSLIAAERQQILDTKTIAINAAEEKRKKGIIAIEIEQLNKANERANAELELQQNLTKYGEDVAKIKSDSARQELDYLANTNKISAEYAANRIAEISRENQQIVYQSQLREATLQRDATIRAALQKASEEQLKTGDPDAGMAVANEASERANKLFEARKIALDAANESTTRAIELTRQQSVETAKQNELLKQQAELLNLFTGIADTLSSAFGKSGEILSNFVSALGASVKTQMDYNTQRDRLLKIESDYQSKAKSGEEITPEDIAKRTKAEKDLGDLNKQNIKNEISGYAQIAGSAKKLFKEKTVAYKLLAGVEKAMHITKLAMDAKELLVKLGVIKTGIAASVTGEVTETGVKKAGALSRVPTYIGEIYGKTIGQLGPIAGPLVAAGLAAFVVSLLGGSNKSPPGGFTAEEQQKVQGTGQYYDSSGRLQNTGGGALGDATQKSKTVENAISNMERYDFKNLQYSNKMLKALYEIRDNTKNFATSIIKALPGINLGPTSTSSGNWLFGKTTTTTLDRGLQVVGTIGEIIDRTADIFQYTNTQYKSSGFLGIFGGGTSYGTERTMVEDEGLSRNLSLIFSSAGEAIGQAAQTLGMGSVEDTLQKFRGIDLSEEFGRISLMDLDPSEMTDALNSVVSAAIDSATAEMFPYLVKFQEIGETMGDTILRLANDMNVVTLSLQELGLTLPQLAESGTTASAAMLQRVSDAEDAYKEAFAASKEIRTVWMDSGESGYYQEVEGSAEATANLTAAERELQAARQAVADANRGITTNNIELVQSLIDAAGGLENFVEQNRFFAENFLTETERLVPVQKSLTAELDRLGLSSVDTMEEFKELVLGIDFATEEGRNLYQSLMDIAPAFAAVYDSTSKVLDQKEFEQKLYDQETTILQLLNDDQELLNRKRAKEIEELSKYSDAQSAVLVANQKYIYALEDENKIREKLIKQRDKEKKALEDTIKTLQSAIDALQNYKKNLLTSDLTTLTPLQQYQQNKAEFDTLSAVLASSTSTAEEKATAASKLPAAADKLLNSSRTLFASGAQYQADFDRVLGVIDSSTQFLEAQKTDAQKQLDELIASTAFLDSIEDNTKTTADLLKELEDAERKTEEKRVAAVKTAEQWQVDVLTVLQRGLDPASITTATELTTTAAAPTTASVSVDTGSAASSSGTSAVADTAANSTIANTTVAAPTIEAPVIVVTAAVSQPLIASISNLVTSVDGVAAEVSGLRTDNAEQTQAIVYSTYDSSDKNAKSISTAVVEEKSISTFTASNSPTVDSDRVSTIDR